MLAKNAVRLHIVFMNSFYNLEDRLLDFAAEAIRVSEKLKKTYAAQHVARQLIRSATSPMASHREAQAAESRNDFIHKMKIAHKELRESIRWMRLIVRVPLTEEPAPATALIRENEELIRIFHASIKTANANKT